MADEQDGTTERVASSPRKPTWQRILGSAEMIGLVLAVLGIVFAWWHVKDLEKIEHSMSTRSIGGFPDFVDDVETTARGAKRSLTIACDFPAYGEFDGKGLPIQRAIQDKLGEGKRVQLTFYTPEKRDKARRAQFPETQWNEAMQNEQEKKKMLAFMRSHGYNKPTTPVYADFGDVMRDYDTYLLHHQFQGAEVKEVANDMPLFFWIADDSEAVMVAQTEGGHEDSAFVTRDAQLITALKTIAADYRQSALLCPPSPR